MTSNLNPWESTRNLIDSAELHDEDLAASTLQSHKRLLAIRLLIAVILGVPGALLAPFAAWLAVASIGQIILNSTPLAIPVLIISLLALLGLLCLWWFVIFGLQSGALKIFQIGGIGVGAGILFLVMAIQFSGSFH